MIAPCFVDANVLVYACDPADVRKQSVARALIERLWVEQRGRTGVEVMVRALKVESRYRLNWWDALTVAAAQLQGCRILYSEDLQHGAVFGTVQVRNPFLEQVNEPPPPDYASPRRTTPHRPRGRPRKTASVP